MQKNFLITGSPSRLTVDIAHECLAQKQNVLLTLEPGMETPAIPPGLEENLQYVEWSRRSPISARFVLLQAINQQIDLDHAVVVFSPRGDRTVFHDQTAAVFEERVDTEIKGVIFMLKELLTYFIKQKRGQLTLVLVEQADEPLGPLDAMAVHGIHGFWESLIRDYAAEPLVLRGIVGKSGQNRQLAEYTLQMLLEDTPRTRGKIHKQSGKLSFFNFGK